MQHANNLPGSIPITRNLHIFHDFKSGKNKGQPVNACH